MGERRPRASGVSARGRGPGALRPLGFCLAGLLLACSPPPGPPNLLLISLDALRADHLGAYGYERDTSPFLDSLAAEGTLHRHAFVNTHGTPPSHTTMLTGHYQRTHRVSVPPDPGFHWAHVAPEELVTVPERLRERGYQNIAVTAGGFMSARFGLAQGFDVYDDESRGVEQGVARLLQQLGARRDDPRPIFALFHTYEIHAPYAPPTRYHGRFGRFESDVEPSIGVLMPLQARAAEEIGPGDFAFLASRYDEGIRYTDDSLRALWEGLQRLGFFGNHLVVVTSDHGEEFGDHGGLMHRDTLYEELLRVPLLLWGPRVPAGVVREGLASHIDIAPTLLAAAGVPLPPELPGRDLLSRDADEAGRAVFAQYAERRHAVRTARWKWIENADGSVELYDLEEDPGEQHNRAADREEIARSLREELRVWRETTPRPERERAPTDLPEEERQRLRALGYGA